MKLLRVGAGVLVVCLAGCGGQVAVGGGESKENGAVPETKPKDVVPPVSSRGSSAPSRAPLAPPPGAGGTSGGPPPVNVPAATTTAPSRPPSPPVNPPRAPSPPMGGVFEPDAAAPPSGGAPANYIVGGVANDDRLAVAYWTGTAEATALVDPFTGRATFTGNLCDLYVWQGQLEYDDVNRTMYAIGQNRANVTKLYTLSLDTQQCTSIALDITEADGAVINYALGGATPDGWLVAAYWNGSVELVALIDPATGRTIPKGQLGNLYMWQDQLVYDDTHHMVYALGEDRARARHVYSLSLDSGTVTSADYSAVENDGGTQSYAIGGATRDGQLVAAFWNGEQESVVLLDPTNAATTEVGTLGDLYLWQGQLAYGGHDRFVFAIGQDRGGDSHFYSLAVGR